ncbi:MAG: glycogen debranching protein GlgX [Phycisphaerae bacterium]|nr:glycogen debranching protein GlgX [Phycisphaerae bacterium]MDW8263014.1 glycogen debranching protein GlgX [Phycisphaerales bacterium]
METQVAPGRPYPLGSTVTSKGVNFSVYSRHATLIELLLFDHVDAAEPSRLIILDPSKHRTHDFWHAFLPGIGVGQVYAFRAHGPHEPERGLRFDAAKLLFDPYGLAMGIPAAYSRLKASQPGDTTAIAPRSIVFDPTAYDWEDDAPPRRPLSQTVIYEMHVRGFTANPNSGIPEPRRGTFAGLVEKIPYLQDLGVTAVELLPVMQFDAQDAKPGLQNYWGYSTLSFFAPHVAFSVSRNPLAAIDEFRDMVKALHRAGIEVILDVVYNHTAEGNESGPTLCYRGLDNTAYYILERDKQKYANFTGCGNTINASHSVVRRMVLDSLRYWVQHMHVDGFRFDLAAIFSRDHKGRVDRNQAIIWDIENDPVLAHVKVIAEPWDAAGLNQVGQFGGGKWKEWNDRFRDDVRRFVRGDGGAVRGLASRILGSPDLYEKELRDAEQSINFVTCHDGFTLHDLYSYDSKHNEANGEDGKDGSDNNLSWNCGVEGPTDDPEIRRLRLRLCKNAMAVLMLSLGTPMMLMGDEVLRTQQGNNNAYCHDSELSWFDWSLLQINREMHEFVRRLIKLRLSGRLEAGPREQSLAERLRKARIRWHSTKLRHPDWSDHSRCVAMTFTTVERAQAFHLIFNGSEHDLDFEIPRPPKAQRAWLRLVDTSAEAGEEVKMLEEAPAVEKGVYHAKARSVIMLWGRVSPDEELLEGDG